MLNFMIIYDTIQDISYNDNDSHWCDKVLALGTSGHKLLLVALVAVEMVLPEKDKNLVKVTTNWPIPSISLDVVEWWQFKYWSPCAPPGGWQYIAKVWPQTYNVLMESYNCLQSPAWEWLYVFVQSNKRFKRPWKHSFFICCATLTHAFQVSPL